MDKKIMTYNFCIHMHFVTPWHVFKNRQYEMDFSGSFFLPIFHPTLPCNYLIKKLALLFL